MASATGFRNILTIDQTSGVIGGFDTVAGMTIGTGGGRTVAIRQREAVNTGAIFFLLSLMAGTTAELFLHSRIGNLVGTVTGEAIHASRLHQPFVH